MHTPIWIRDGHDNNFTLLRILMALAVLVGHAVIIGSRDLGAEPMVYGTYSISYMAVNAFFVASGFLVTASMLHRKDTVEFASARIMRIYPALIVHVLAVMLIVGAANTVLPLWQYMTSPDVWKHVPLVLTFTGTDFVLPGVFTANHEPYASAPLWTLRYEVLAYIGTGVAFSLGLLKRPWMLALGFAAIAVGYTLLVMTGWINEVPATLRLIARFALPYSLGAAIYAYRDRLPFRAWIAVACMAAAFVGRDSAIAELSMNLAVAYALFLLAYMPTPLRTWTIPDISYGLYIWHWPILQWAAAAKSDLSSPSLIAIAMVATPMVAYASWIFVEKPMLAKKSTVSAWLRRPRSVPA